MSRRKGATAIGSTGALYAGMALVALLATGVYTPSDENLMLAVYRGVLYAPETDRSEVLFRFTAWMSEDGQHRQIRFRGPEGTLLTSERVWLRAGEFDRYEIEHHGAQRSGTIRREGERLLFRFTRDGETEEREETFRSPLLVPASLVPFIETHWAELVRGERFRVRLGVAYARRSIGFELARREEPEEKADDLVTIRMKPTNFLIRRIVDPIDLRFTPQGDEVREIIGRASALRPTPNGWERTAAEGVYQKIAP